MLGRTVRHRGFMCVVVSLLVTPLPAAAQGRAGFNVPDVLRYVWCTTRCSAPRECCVVPGSQPTEYACVPPPLTDPMNCGSCGNVCDKAARNIDGDLELCCSGGTCIAPNADPIQVAPQFLVDANNCGRCGTRCGQNQWCSQGTCCDFCSLWLPGPSDAESRCYTCDEVANRTGTHQACCNNRFCTNVSTNTNCGACNKDCTLFGAVCDQEWPSWSHPGRGPACVCPANQPDACPAAPPRFWQCVNLSSDFYNCGSCGHRCPPDTDRCRDGGCDSSNIQ